jgi:phage tail sheath protein FI
MSTSTTLAKNRKTPGVYVTEFPSFPPSVVGVPTAIPIFIGYTETAADPSSKKQMYLQAVPLSSMSDYISYFGQGFNAKGVVAQQPANATSYDFQAVIKVLSATGATVLDTTTGLFSIGTSDAPSVADEPQPDVGGNGPAILLTTAQFNLYSAMQMFFANGGGNCYVVSVNNYWGSQTVVPTPAQPAAPISDVDLMKGLDIAAATRGPTMLVMPDAALFPPVTVAGVTSYPQYSKVVVAMLKQAKALQDRPTGRPGPWRTRPPTFMTRSARPPTPSATAWHTVRRCKRRR